MIRYTKVILFMTENSLVFYCEIIFLQRRAWPYDDEHSKDSVLRPALKIQEAERSRTHQNRRKAIEILSQ